MNTHFLKEKKGGFTIIESLVAISILVIVIIGVTGAVQRSLSSYIFSKDQIIAFYLAQEAFEKVRNLRDENALNGRDWLSGLAADSGDPCYYGNSCMVSPIETSLATRCPSAGACPVLRQDSQTGVYGYNPGSPPSIFTRDISFTFISPTEIAVTVTMSWSKGGISRQFRVRENLLNWQSLI